MEKKYIYILVIAVVVYFVFFKKSNEAAQKKASEPLKPKFAGGLKGLNFKFGMSQPGTETEEGGIFRKGIFKAAKNLSFSELTKPFAPKINIPAGTIITGEFTQSEEGKTIGIMTGTFNGKSFIGKFNISDWL